MVLSIFWARILDFRCWEVRIGVPLEIALSLLYVPDVTQWRK